MENEFVTYKIAATLEKLGFNEKCFAYFDYYGKRVELCLKDYNWDGCGQDAPLKQQVFRWFRERYGISHSIYMYNNKIVANVSGNNYGSLIYEIASYEEAENACIDKLIEIAKQQSNG